MYRVGRDVGVGCVGMWGCGRDRNVGIGMGGYGSGGGQCMTKRNMQIHIQKHNFSHNS